MRILVVVRAALVAAVGALAALAAPAGLGALGACASSPQLRQPAETERSPDHPAPAGGAGISEASDPRNEMCDAARMKYGLRLPDDRAAITGVLTRQVDAWNRGDLAGYMAGYASTPALIFTSGGNIRRGWQDAYDHYKARYATDPKAMGTLAFSIDSIDPVGCDGAVVLGHWQLTHTEQAGHGVFTLVMERRPEGWRIIHDHTSSGPDASGGS